MLFCAAIVVLGNRCPSMIKFCSATAFVFALRLAQSLFDRNQKRVSELWKEGWGGEGLVGGGEWEVGWPRSARLSVARAE